MPAAAAVGMLDMVGMVDIVIGGVVSGGDAAAIPAIGIAADGGGTRPGVPALPSARAPAIEPPLPAIDTGAREPAVLTGCERDGEVSALCGLQAPIAIAAITPKLSPPPLRLHSLICNLVGQTRPTDSVRPPHPRVSAVMPRFGN